MRIRRAAAAAIVVVLSCAGFGSAALASPKGLKGKSGDYLSTDPSVPVQAFIYADHTVVQLDSYKSALQVLDDSGGSIGYVQDGKFANVAGKLNHFVAIVNGQRVVFTRVGYKPASESDQEGGRKIAPGVTLDAGEHEISDTATETGASKQRIGDARDGKKGVAPKDAQVKRPTAEAPPLLDSNPAQPTTPALTGTSDTHEFVAADKSARPSTAPNSLLLSTSTVATKSIPTTASVPSDVSSAASAIAQTPRAGAPAAAGQPFELVAGTPLEGQLFAWAKKAGWTVLWNLPDDNNWIVPGGGSYGTDFETAVKRVIEDLAGNGADIVGDSWRGNHTIVISQSGATDQ